MYILKNAFVSIVRNKGRNILIGFIIIAIATSTSISLAIRNSASSLISSYENQYDVTATIGINRESMREEMRMDKDMSDSKKDEVRENMKDVFEEASNLTEEDIASFGDSSYVKSYYYQMSMGVNSSKLEKVSFENSEEEKDGFSNRPMMGAGGKENFQNLNASDFTLIGYSDLTAMEDFVVGNKKIVSGTMNLEEDSKSCVINQELATFNDLEVGDTVTFEDANDEDNTLKLTIVGIYEEESTGNDRMGMFTASANTILTNTDVIHAFLKKDEDISLSVTPTFVLNRKEDVDDFQKELTEKGLSEYLTVTTNLDQVEGSTKTISNVLNFATTFLILTLLIGAIVLFIVNMMNIRERKYEIGVLRTIGMKKRFVTFQFLFELFVVSFVSLFIGAGLGAILSVPIGNSLLESEIQNAAAERNQIQENFGGRDLKMNDSMKAHGMLTVQAFDSIDAVVDGKVLLELFGVGLLLTLLSSTASMIYIQRFSPLTILKERSS